MPLSWLIVAAWTSVVFAIVACTLMLFDILVPAHYSRWPLYASVAVLGFASMVCFFAASDEWTEQWTEGSIVGIDSVHVRYAIELCAFGALEILAGIVLLLRRSGWGWWFAVGVQAGILVLAEIEALVMDPNVPGWSEFARFPLVALFLLVAIRIAQSRMQTAVDRDLTPRLAS